MTDATMTVIVTSECIVREKLENGSWKLTFLGQPNDPLREATERCNAGKASEVDLIALSTLPVFDADAEPVIEIVSR